MTNTARALYGFFSGFGLPAFVENTVPDDAELPYITYELRRPDRLRQVSIHARIWYYSPTYEDIAAKVDEIYQTIVDGYSVPTGDGALRLWPDDNWMQFQPPDEPELKIAYLSMILESDYN